MKQPEQANHGISLAEVSRIETFGIGNVLGIDQVSAAQRSKIYDILGPYFAQAEMAAKQYGNDALKQVIVPQDKVTAVLRILEQAKAEQNRK